jgi:hypothetical protein
MFCMDLSRHKLFFLISFVIFILFTVQSFAGQPNSAFFFIEVLDQQTERGVPMVELRTTSQIRLYTDSNGIAAFYEPGLMGQKVFFYVESPGYEFPADGFGIRGTTLDTQPGRTATLKIKRQNIAQRLYRITGQGIYRDSVIAGQKVPIQEPLLNGKTASTIVFIKTSYSGSGAIRHGSAMHWGSFPPPGRHPNYMDKIPSTPTAALT